MKKISTFLKFNESESFDLPFKLKIDSFVKYKWKDRADIEFAKSIKDVKDQKSLISASKKIKMSDLVEMSNKFVYALDDLLGNTNLSDMKRLMSTTVDGDKDQLRKLLTKLAS